MGITRCDHMLMLLGVCIGMEKKEQEISTREMIRGFNEKAVEAKTLITGGQSVYNEYPIIGGVANTVVGPEEIIMPKGGKEGDLLILTKPLGTRIAVNLHQWMKLNNDKWKKASAWISEEKCRKAFDICCTGMSGLNLTAAELMRAYHCHGATDVTGFGILGHAKNLAEAQQEPIDLVIHSLPTIAGMAEMSDKVVKYSFLKGYTAETSGGLLIMADKQLADDYCKEFKKLTGRNAWIIGEVVKGKRTARLSEKLKITEVAEI